MSRTIKHNEVLGRQVEEMVAKDYPGSTRPYQYTHGPYDIETPTLLMEVKSCQVKTKNRRPRENEKDVFREGRFSILLDSHEKLREMAKEAGKEPRYVFILYEPENIDKYYVARAELSWEQVDQVLRKLSTWKRYDGTQLVNVPYSLLIPILEEKKP